MAFSLDMDSFATPDGEKKPQTAAADKPAPQITSAEQVGQEVGKELEVSDQTKKAIESGADPKVEQIMSVDLTSLSERRAVTDAIRKMGDDDVKGSNQSNALLQTTLQNLGAGSSNTDSVGNQLADLAHTIEELNPEGVDFYKKGLFGKLTSPARRYLERYETAEKKINEIVRNLERGSRQLEADSKTLEQESVAMQARSKRIAQDAEIARTLSVSLKNELDQRKALANPEDTERIRWVENEVLFPLTRKAQSLEVQLATNQQGIIAMEVAKRNNDTLIDSVHDATTTSIQLLRTGITLQAALQNQKRVADQVQAINDANSELIRSNARMLQENGAEIQRIAAAPAVDPAALEEAYETCLKAVQDADTFREKAIPEMQATTETFHQLYLKSKAVTDRLTTDDAPDAR